MKEEIANQGHRLDSHLHSTDIRHRHLLRSDRARGRGRMMMMTQQKTLSRGPRLIQLGQQSLPQAVPGQQSLPLAVPNQQSLPRAVL